MLSKYDFMDYGMEKEVRTIYTTELTDRERAVMQAMDRMRRIQIGQIYPQLSAGEEHLLSVLITREEGITVSALAEELHMTMSAVSRLMRSMEERNLIERRIQPQDRRSIIVTVTDEGRKSCEELHARLHHFFMEMLATFDPDEFDAVLGTWNAIMNRMETVLAKQTAEIKEIREKEEQIQVNSSEDTQ